MAVHCPQCAHPASTSSAEIGPGGQLLTCEKCGTRWLARRFDQDPYGVDLRLTTISDVEVVEEPPPPDLRLLPPRWRKPPSRSARILEKAAKVCGVLVAIFAAVVVLRAPIVAALPMLPSTTGLPAATSALAFDRVRSELLRIHGRETLLVDGEVVNPTATAISLPAIRITVNSPEGSTVRSWLVEPSQDSVGPGSSVRFRSALAAPPETVSDITLNLERRSGRIDGV